MSDKDSMMEPYVTIMWVPQDIKTMVKPDWSDEKCQEVLARVAKQLEERSIEFGFDLLHSLVEPYDDEDDEE